jgi:hypothetical protein
MSVPREKSQYSERLARPLKFDQFRSTEPIASPNDMPPLSGASGLGEPPRTGVGGTAVG